MSWIPSLPTTGAEHWWGRWIPCLIKTWSSINSQSQLHTRIAYTPVYMTYVPYSILLFMTGTNMRHNHTISAIHSSGHLHALPFHFRQWLSVCAIKIGASNTGNLFPKCQQVLGRTCIHWDWSHWPITIQHAAATWRAIDPWRACSTEGEKAAWVIWSFVIFLNRRKICVF